MKMNKRWSPLIPKDSATSESAQTKRSDAIGKERRPIILSSIFRLFFFFIAILVAMIAVAWGTIRYMQEEEPEVTVPDVQGMDVIKASETMDESNLYVRLISVDKNFTNESAKDTTIPTPKYQVVSQYPEAGMNVKAGREILLRVNMSDSISIVPNFAGQPLREAYQFLTHDDIKTSTTNSNRYCIPGTITYRFDDQPVGTVIAQDPAADTLLSDITPVHLMVSKGKNLSTITIPNLKNWLLPQAVAFCSISDIPYHLKYKPITDAKDEGLILDQSIPADTLFSQKEILVLTVSTLQKEPPYFYRCCELVIPTSKAVLELYQKGAKDLSSLDLSISYTSESRDKTETYQLFKGAVYPGDKIVQCYKSLGKTKELVTLNGVPFQMRTQQSKEKS